MIVRWVRALGAAVVLLALLVGVPLLLLRLIGSPLQAAQDLLAGDVTDQVVLAVLAVIACGAGLIAWLQFTAAFVVEFASGIRRAPVPARVPGVFAGQQRLARGLVTALLLLGPTVLSAVGPTAAAATAAVMPAMTASAAATPMAGEASRAPTPAAAPVSAQAPPLTATTTVTLTADGPRTWWTLAEQYLHSGDQWRTLWDLNDGARQADGTVLSSSTTVLRAGWEIAVPVDATGDAAVAAVAPTGDTATAEGAEVVVSPGDSLSSLAAAHGTDWATLWELNEGLEQPDGQVLTDPDYLEPGWTVRLPAPPEPAQDGTVTVRPGDTLSEIAADRGSDTTSLWTWNQGRVQPDGERFTDPNYLEPGWTVTLSAPDAPAAANDPASTTAAPSVTDQPQPDGVTPESAPTDGAAGSEPQTQGSAPVPVAPGADTLMPDVAVPDVAGPAAAPSAAAPDDQAPVADPTGPAVPSGVEASAPAGPTAPAQPTPAAGAPAAPSASAPAVPSRQPSTATAASTPAAAAAAAEAAGVDADRSSAGAESAPPLAMLAAGGGAVVLTAVALMAFQRARRRQFRLRRPGRAVASSPPEVARMERVLLTAGRRGFADVTWLDEALRSLVHASASIPDAQLPDVIGVRIGGRELELMLATPLLVAPSPWRVSSDGTRWTVRRRDALPYDEPARDYHIPPFPLLVSVGYTPTGDHFLLDLERIGSVTLSGDPDRCLDLARYMAAELTHNSWSELFEVTLVGFGEEMADVSPAQLTHVETLSAVLPGVRAHLNGVSEVMIGAGVDVATGRLRNIAGDAWAPHVVLVSPAAAADDPQALTGLIGQLQQDRHTIAVVLTSAEDQPALQLTRWQLTVDAEGVLTVPALGLQLVAEQLPADEAAPLTQLLVAVGVEQDQPMPPAAGSEPWDEFSDAVGNLRPSMTTAVAAPAVRLAGTWPARPHSILPLAPTVYADAAAISERDVEVLAPGVDQQVRDRLVAADPTLEEDLAAWWDDSSPRVKLRLLGPVEVWSATLEPAPSGKPQKVEAVAYLATRTRGASASLVRTDLWPDDPGDRPTSKVRNLMNGTRTWLGVNPATGREHLPPNIGEDRGGLYRVEGVLVDAELFRRVRLRAMARGGAEAISDLWAALHLVSGVPFEAHRPRGYGWISELVAQYTALVADAAHTVATHHLAAGEPERAAAAAQVALLAGSQGDDVLLDLVTACHARGDQDSGDLYVRRIVDNHGEVEEDIPPATYDYLLTKGWLPRRSA